MSRRVNITFISQMRTLKFKVIKYNMLLFVLNSNKIKVVNILVWKLEALGSTPGLVFISCWSWVTYFSKLQIIVIIIEIMYLWF